MKDIPKKFGFIVRVEGYEEYEVVAESAEEAIEKLKCDPDEYKTCDDLGWSRGVDEDDITYTKEINL